MKKFGLIGLFLLIFSGCALAQGPQCRTSPVGASTPSCASEAFVTKSIAGSAVTEQKNTAGAGLSTSGNCDNTSTNASSPCQYALSLTGATLEATPGNPTGTSNTTGLMMGLGSTCKLTPVYSRRVKLEFIGNGNNNVAQDGWVQKVFYGTGTAPINGVAITGTQVGSGPRTDTPTSSSGFNGAFANGGVITGLTPGTAYWFDLSLAAVNGGTASLLNISCNAFEF